MPLDAELADIITSDAEVGERVSAVAAAQRRASTGQWVTIRPASERACSTCPWRVSNQTVTADETPTQ